MPDPTPAPEPTPAPVAIAPTPEPTPAPSPAPSPTPAPIAAPPQADWRAALKTDEAKEFAKNSADVDHLVNRALDMRRQLSTAIIKPGKDAKPEQVAAYRKAMDIPDDPKGYGIAKPEHYTDEVFQSEAVQSRIGAIAKIAHDHGVPRGAMKGIIDEYFKMEAGVLASQVEADTRFAAETDAQLKKEWGADYDKNKEFANRAFGHIAKQAGVDVQALKEIETKGGRFLMDDPSMVRIFAALGREMGEGTLGALPTAAERAGGEQEIRDIRAQIAEAQAQGDRRRANELYQQEQALLARTQGNQPIVGAQGRAA